MFGRSPHRGEVRLLEQKIGVPEDAAERSADLVAHRGQELGFRPVRGFGDLARRFGLARPFLDAFGQRGVELAQRTLGRLPSRVVA